MGTTAQKLTYTANAINGIKSVLEERGVVVGDTPIGNYASLIESISTDGTTSFAEKTLTEVTARMIGGITQIGDYAFYNQAGLTTIEIPSTVTSIGDYAFYGCTSIATIYFPGTASQWSSITKGTNWDGNTGAYSIVYGSVGLSFTSNGDGTCYVSGIGTCIDTDLVIPDVSPIGDTVTSISSNAFLNCTGITSVAIPDSITNIGSGAFSGCYNIVSMTIPFVGESRKTTSDTYQYPFGYLFGTIAYDHSKQTYQTYHGSSTSSTTYTAYYIPESLRSVKVTGGNILYGSFQYCSMLTSITVPDNIISIEGESFMGCRNLISFTVPSGVTNVARGAFYNCSNLESINIPDGITSFSRQVFYGCQKLLSIRISNNITSIGNEAFESCSSLGSEEILTIPERVTYIGEHAFGSTKYTSLIIPDGVIGSIGGYAFSFCSKMTSVVIGNGITSIGDGAFNYCTGITSVVIGNNVTEIGDYSFEDCSGLKSITIPASVTSIGLRAFRYCGLNSATILATTPPSLASVNAFNGSYPIYVPAESVDTYKSATGWSELASRIQAMPS